MRDAAAVVVVDLQAERLGAAGDRLADPSHADDAEPLTPDAMAEHPGRAPASPVLVAGQHLGALGQPPRHGKDQRHGHVGGILGEDARRVGHGDAALQRGCHVDIVDAVAEIGDQLQLFAGMTEHGSVDVVGHRRHDHFGCFGSLGEIALAHRLVVEIKPSVEQLAHARFDAVGKFAGDDDQRLFARCHSMPLALPLAQPETSVARSRPALPALFSRIRPLSSR
jgi:hypothetical protein